MSLLSNLGSLASDSGNTSGISSFTNVTNTSLSSMGTGADVMIDWWRDQRDENDLAGTLGLLTDYPECRIAKSIADSYLWVECAIGIPGNVITIITILTMQAMSPATLFVVLLAFFDGAALVLKAFFFFSVRYNLIDRSDMYCKMEFLPASFTTIANWMLVLICLERFVSVCFPLKKVYLFTKKRSYIMASLVISFFIIVYAPIFAVMRVLVPGYRLCTVKTEYVDFWDPYFLVINTSFYLFVPFLLILALTIAIVRGLFVARRDRRSLMRKGSKTESGEAGNDRAAQGNQRLLAATERTERTITFMVIFAAIMFVILALPPVIYTIGSNRNKTYGKNCYTSQLIATWTLFQQIQYVFVDSSHAINFILYFLAAKRFRDHMIGLLLCKKCKKQKYKTNFQNTHSTALSSSSRVTQSIAPQSPCVEIS